MWDGGEHLKSVLKWVFILAILATFVVAFALGALIF